MSLSKAEPRLLSAHPVAGIGEFLWPRERAETRSLLLGTPGMSFSYNARGALLEVGQELMADGQGRDEVLVPAFHCPSGITPLIEAGLKPVYYRIRTDLSIDVDDLLAKVRSRTRAVVVIHFFGFETDLGPLQALRSQGVSLVEDWSHSFLQVAPLRLPRPQGDYQVFSFWKLVPSGVGGGLLRLTQPIARGWSRGATSWREGAVRFKRELEEVLAHSPHRSGAAIFDALEGLRLGLRGQPGARLAADNAQALRGEDHYPFDRTLAAAAMPSWVRHRLLSSDLADMAAKRRDHYATYARLLPQNDDFRPLRRELTGDVCPWVFPVLLKNRDHIDRQWRAAGVPLHTFGIWLHSSLEHDTDQATRDDAALLARELLCLSIHQGLQRRHIEYAAHVIGDHFNADRAHAA